MTVTDYEFGTGARDEIPALSDDLGGGGDFDPRYPGSTPDAPFGFKPDGSPYKRHHGGKGSRSTGSHVGRMPASDKQAETAAALLAKLNWMVGMAIGLAGFPETGTTIHENNAAFEVMAKEALEADPILCKKILSGGATSGRVGLITAYGMLGLTTGATAVGEYKTRKATKNVE